MNGLWMVYERIVNAYEWICIRLFYIVILHRLQQTLSPSPTDKVKQYQLQKLSRQWNKIAVPPSPQNGGKTNRSRISLVSFPYRSRINPVSFSYRPPIVLLSFSLPEAETIRKQYGNNTEPIYLGREDDMRMRLSGYLEVGLLRLKTLCWRCATNAFWRVF